MADNPMLQVEGLCFAYPECAVLAQWSVALPAGVSLVRGDESSGKTTLMRLLAGELAPQSGAMTLLGQTIGSLGKAAPSAVFWADPRSDAWDAGTARGWLDSLPARYPRWTGQP